MNDSIYKAVLLDFDGTLANSAPGIVFCMRRTFAAFGRPEPEAREVQKTIGLPLDQGIARLAPDAGSREVVRLREAYRECYVDRGKNMAQLYSGVEEVLARIKAAGLFSAVVSNKAQGPLEKTLEALDMDQYFDLVVGTLPERVGKPDPGIWDAAIRPSLGSVEGVLMVGDAEPDLRFARAVGLAAAWAAYGYGDEAICRSHAPEHVLGSPSDLLTVLGV